jgi:hypothetical protein
MKTYPNSLTKVEMIGINMGKLYSISTCEERGKWGHTKMEHVEV